MYDKILVPLDGSTLAEMAIPFVEEFISGAKESRDLEITLVQIVPEKKTIFFPSAIGSGGIASVPYTEEESNALKESATSYLQKIGSKIKKTPKVTIKILVMIGDDAANEILKIADELKVDLITISSHGRSGITRWALGSVADKILRGGNTPVFMVRGKE